MGVREAVGGCWLNDPSRIFMIRANAVKRPMENKEKTSQKYVDSISSVSHFFDFLDCLSFPAFKCPFYRLGTVTPLFQSVDQRSTQRTTLSPVFQGMFKPRPCLLFFPSSSHQHSVLRTSAPSPFTVRFC